VAGTARGSVLFRSAMIDRVYDMIGEDGLPPLADAALRDFIVAVATMLVNR
jgi:hypothetical protein